MLNAIWGNRRLEMCTATAALFLIWLSQEGIAMLPRKGSRPPTSWNRIQNSPCCLATAMCAIISPARSAAVYFQHPKMVDRPPSRRDDGLLYSGRLDWYSIIDLTRVCRTIQASGKGGHGWPIFLSEVTSVSSNANVILFIHFTADSLLQIALWTSQQSLICSITNILQL